MKIFLLQVNDDFCILYKLFHIIIKMTIFKLQLCLHASCLLMFGLESHVASSVENQIYMATITVFLAAGYFWVKYFTFNPSNI